MEQGGWSVFPETGFVVNSLGHWARVDFSPLGSGSMAAHGHLDAQHLSLWLKGQAMVIDPGTGDYHGIRNYEIIWLRVKFITDLRGISQLAKREGPFLWGGIHPRHCGVLMKFSSWKCASTAVRCRALSSHWPMIAKDGWFGMPLSSNWPSGRVYSALAVRA